MQGYPPPLQIPYKKKNTPCKANDESSSSSLQPSTAVYLALLGLFCTVARQVSLVQKVSLKACVGGYSFSKCSHLQKKIFYTKFSKALYDLLVK